MSDSYITQFGITRTLCSVCSLLGITTDITIFSSFYSFLGEDIDSAIFFILLKRLPSTLCFFAYLQHLIHDLIMWVMSPECPSGPKP